MMGQLRNGSQCGTPNDGLREQRVGDAMKRVLMAVLAVLYVAVMTGFFYMLMNDDHHFRPEKPVLYLYPQEERQLTVTRDRTRDPGLVDCDGGARRNVHGPSGVQGHKIS